MARDRANKVSGTKTPVVESGTEPRQLIHPVDHAEFYDPASMPLVKDTFREVWAVIEGQNALAIGNEADLKRTIMRKLMDLVADGVRDKEALKTETLRQLPLR